MSGERSSMPVPEVFSTRITQEMRDALEAEITRSGQSISRTAERLMWIGIEAIKRGLVLFKPASIEFKSEDDAT